MGQSLSDRDSAMTAKKRTDGHPPCLLVNASYKSPLVTVGSLSQTEVTACKAENSRPLRRKREGGTLPLQWATAWLRTRGWRKPEVEGSQW